MQPYLKALSIGFALGVLALTPAPGIPQERTPEVVERLLEKRGPAAPQFVPGEVIVKMKYAFSFRADDLRRLGLEEKERITSGGEIIYRIPASRRARMSAAALEDATLAVVDELSRRADVEYAQPNFILRIADTTPNDPRYGEQWHYFNNGSASGQSPGGISLPRAWDQSTGSNAVVVAVIDTGILPNHPDVQGSPNLAPGYDMISDPAIGNDGGGRDSDPTDPGDAIAANECYPGSPAQPDSWHGTHVAGTIGVGRTNNAVGVAGINWNVRVQAVRVLGKCGGTTADINDGIRWAAGLPVPGVPNNPTPAKVINLSLGTPPGTPCSRSPATQAAINDAAAMGVTVVVAAGNDAVDASQVLPASCSNVITVAASDYRGNLVTRYSNYGATVEIMAPGGDVRRDDNGDGRPDGVLSLVHPNAGTYAFYNGTSMAAPHVAGAAALLLAGEPGLTPAQVLARLQQRALPRSSAQCPQPCGAGLLSAAGPAPPPEPPPAPLALALTVENSALETGESTRARARVTRSGVPVTGKSVRFSSDNPGIASLSPAEAATDANGEAVSVLKGESRGETTVRAAANGASDAKPVKVPDLSLLAAVALLAALLAAGGRRGAGRRGRPGGSGG
jgi:serine protease